MGIEIFQLIVILIIIAIPVYLIYLLFKIMRNYIKLQEQKLKGKE